MKKDIDRSPELFSSVLQSSQISAVYNNTEELTELLAIYFKQGIEKGEYCLWFSPYEMDAERTKDKLKKSGIDIDHCIASSQLELHAAEQLPKDVTLLASTIKQITEKGSQKVLLGGFAGFRTNIDFKNSGSPLNSYLETCKKIAETVNSENSSNLTLLCTLPLDELSGSTLLELMEKDGVFVKRKGEWKYLRQLEGQPEFETVLLKAKKDAETANRAKNAFIMNISHQLRTPLNSVIGFSDLLLEGAFGPLNLRQSKYVTNILISGRNLLEIIDNLLDISRLEAGEITLTYEEIDIAGLIGEVRVSLLSLASSKKIIIDFKVDPSIGSIRADKAKIRQILYNLISSAIKFTPKKGKVIVNAFKKEGMLTIKVSDTGAGLLKDYYEKVFMPSTNEEPSEKALKSGEAELGLSIVKNFIDLHGGNAYVDSEVGKGSTFTFNLPLD